MIEQIARVIFVLFISWLVASVSKNCTDIYFTNTLMLDLWFALDLIHLEMFGSLQSVPRFFSLAKGGRRECKTCHGTRSFGWTPETYKLLHQRWISECSNTKSICSFGHSPVVLCCVVAPSGLSFSRCSAVCVLQSSHCLCRSYQDVTESIQRCEKGAYSGRRKKRPDMMSC